MQNYNFVVERDADTGLYVGHTPGRPGAHSQGETLGELQGNLREVVAMLLELGEESIPSMHQTRREGDNRTSKRRR